MKLTFAFIISHVAASCDWTQYRITAAENNYRNSQSGGGANQFWQQAAKNELDAANKAKSDCESGSLIGGQTGAGQCGWTQYRITAAENDYQRSQSGDGANQYWQQAAKNELDAAKKAKADCEGSTESSPGNVSIISSAQIPYVKGLLPLLFLIL